MSERCTLALDLGTTAFKAAPVDEQGVCGRVTVVPYTLDYGPEGSVTCDPARYFRSAVRALRGAARTAHEAGRLVNAIGLSCQAQTFVPVDGVGKPVGPAVVWTEARAVEEAVAADRALPDFAAMCGFTRPSPLQFLPKVMRFRREGGTAHRFLLLNEWIACQLTGEAFGDATNQGMGGFYDIARQQWNPAALALAELTPEHLAVVAPAAGYCASLTRQAVRALGLPNSVPVYSCGNDQSCAAVGAGLERAGDLFANFGTALVVYGLKECPVAPVSEEQIAGISPLPSRWFLLGVESECGNVVEWLATLLYPRGGVGRMLEAALRSEIDGRRLPRFALAGGGYLDITRLRVGSRAEELARALLEHYAVRFGELLAGVCGAGERPRRLFAGGGLSRSRAWLDFLAERHQLTLTPTAGEHPGLVGVAKIIARQSE